jgi:lipopolysaccharide/colanic/teichoic acid biosynthesis glycosyltransferase
MKRMLDFLLGVLARKVQLVPLVIVAIAIRLTSKGPPLYWSIRVARKTSFQDAQLPHHAGGHACIGH